MFDKITAISIFALLAVACVLSPLYAGAQTIPMNLVIVKHRFASPLQQEIMANVGIGRLKETGVNYKVQKVKIVRDTLSVNKLSQYTSRLDRWYNLAIKKGWCFESQPCHLSLPPVFDSSGADYGGGVAFSTDCGGGRIGSFSIARVKNGKGLLRTLSSITSTAHEVGHNSGAEHDDSGANIMHSDALRFGDRGLPWTEDTKVLIDACMYDEGLRKVSKYGFGNPNFKGRSFKGKVVEPLIN